MFVQLGFLTTDYFDHELFKALFVIDPIID